MRNIVLTAGVITMLFSGVAYGAQQNEVVIRLDQKPVVLKQDVIYEDNRMMLPVRAMAEVLGADVTYDADTRTAVVQKQMPTVLDAEGASMVWKVSLGLDSDYLTLLDSHELLLDTKPLVVNNRAYLPLRELAEAMNLDVVWHSENDVDYVDLTSARMPEVLLSPISEFDQETMSLMMEWENREDARFYTTEVFQLQKWNGNTWETMEPDKAYTVYENTYSIPTGGPTDGKRERKFTFWQWEKSMTAGKYRVAVPYTYQEGNGKDMTFFTLDQTAAFVEQTPTTYVAYGEFLLEEPIQ